MFGLLPCPKCKNECRWPNQAGEIVCDQCDYKEEISEDHEDVIEEMAKDERNELAIPTGSPRRVQRKRTKGWKMPPNTVSVCRPGKWGNPFKVGERISDMNPSVVQNRAEAVACFRVNLLIGRLDFTVKDVITALAGKNLACFCALDQPCHADVLLSEANIELPHKERSCG